MDCKEQLYIEAETAASDNFRFEDLFDDSQCEVNTDCDGNSVVTEYKWIVAVCFDLRIVLSESSYDNYYHTSMYLDDKEVFSWDTIETPVFLNSILIDCICWDVETDDISIEDTL